MCRFQRLEKLAGVPRLVDQVVVRAEQFFPMAPARIMLERPVLSYKCSFLQSLSSSFLFSPLLCNTSVAITISPFNSECAALRTCCRLLACWSAWQPPLGSCWPGMAALYFWVWNVFRVEPLLAPLPDDWPVWLAVFALRALRVWLALAACPLGSS